MSYWDNKTKVVVQNDEGNTTACKNRFPPSDTGASQTIAAILERLRSGVIEYDSLVITVRGVRRDDVPVLMFGTRDGWASESAAVEPTDTTTTPP
ncbi:uncharacterized protein SRS1_16795 [Sporisorium reilianum f. sp. reilianum]|uniref:Uncharacterized protein n=1 Tax=Sporisorium reilianum f. sp. reilianum TaxID=72559 RepID=A0A2N8UNV6_9BASI|nr:uncharacterized protein SRS1_16795 [Sporisorium reilianum f. sp. reilianum]